MSEDTKCCEETIDYDKISRSLLIRKILQIDDVTLTPKAFNRIMEVIQNMPPSEISDKPNYNY